MASPPLFAHDIVFKKILTKFGPYLMLLFTNWGLNLKVNGRKSQTGAGYTSIELKEKGAICNKKLEHVLDLDILHEKLTPEQQNFHNDEMKPQTMNS